MKNKLLTTTALVGVASLVSIPALAELKVSGNLEQTFFAVSAEGSNSKINSYRVLGDESNIQLQYKKDLQGGLKMDVGFVAEDNGTAAATTTGFYSDTNWLKISSGNSAFAVAQDYGNTTETSLVPFITEGTETSAQTSSFKDQFGSDIATVHEAAHVSYDYSIPGGAVTFRYAPDAKHTRTFANGGDPSGTIGRSAMEYLIRGDIMPGLKAQVGRVEDGKYATTNARDLTVYGLSYTAGQFSIGANFQNLDFNTAGSADKESEQYGVAYKVNDNISAGVYYTKTSQTSGSPDEKVKAVQVGYNLMGLGLEFAYSKVENKGNVSNTDQNVLFIRTIQKF